MEWLCFIGVWFLCGMIAASIYQRKGRSGITGFLGGFLLGPLGVILALASGSNLPKCPFCAERIQQEAKVCPHCQRDLPIGTDKPKTEGISL
jgi:hypothetical protein